MARSWFFRFVSLSYPPPLYVDPVVPSVLVLFPGLGSIRGKQRKASPTVLHAHRPECPLRVVLFAVFREDTGAKEDGYTNIVDILTKLVTGTVLRFLVGCCMWRNGTKPTKQDQR